MTAACTNQSMLNTKNTTVVDASPIYSQDFASARRPRDYYFDYSIRAYGNYYNWYSATAGNGTYEKNENEVVSGDICPTGWHLPYGGYKANEKGGNTSGGFYYLTQSMNNGNSADTANNWRTFPNNIIHSGGYYKSEPRYKALGSSYWTNSAYGSGGSNRIDAFRLDVSTVAYVTGNMQKYFGSSVRCVIQMQ